MNNPANLLGLDYRNPPTCRPAGLAVVDFHTHLRAEPEAFALYMEAAEIYGIGKVVSMTPLADVPAIRSMAGDRVEFIAVPDYRRLTRTREFQRIWQSNIESFARMGVRLCKFWAAPRALAELGLTLDNPWLRPMIDTALASGMGFMVHVADPDLWYATRYADAGLYGRKPDAYRQLEWFAQYVSPRPIVGAHFIGHPEDLGHLDTLLARYPHLMLDTSATKWIAREVSRHPRGTAREFFSRHRQRILFGSDLVLGPDYDFQHYASRFWVQRQLWGSEYDGDSPIIDPDVDGGRVRLRGLNLPDDILRAIYRENYERLAQQLNGR